MKSISEERLLKVILAPHISEKSTVNAENNNTVVFRVAIDATKAEIKAAVAKLFDEIGPKYSDRNGGYTRITRTSYRRGDKTELAVIELV